MVWITSWIGAVVIYGALGCYVLGLDPSRNWGRHNSWISRKLAARLAARRDVEVVLRRAGFLIQLTRVLVYVWIALAIFDFFLVLIPSLARVFGAQHAFRILFIQADAPADWHRAWHDAKSGGVVGLFFIVAHGLSRVENQARSVVQEMSRG